MMIAEESTAWPAVSRPVYVGGLGFTYKWNMGWMHDILTYMSKDPVHRQWEHQHLTFSMLYAFNENFVLPFSHDEVVHGKGSMIGKMPGDSWQKAANLRALYAYMYVHPGKKLLFMGSELAAWREWDDGDGAAVGLGRRRRRTPACGRWCAISTGCTASRRALHQVDFQPTGFSWIDCDDAAHSVISLIRRGRARQGRSARRLQLHAGRARGLSHGRARAGAVSRADQHRRRDLRRQQRRQRRRGSRPSRSPAQGMAQSLVLTLPPLAGLILKRD